MTIKTRMQPPVPGCLFSIFSFLFLCSCGQKTSTADSLNEFTGAPSRAVWVRQVEGEGSDPFCESESLILMGLDGAPGSEERQILPETGNYRKPLITPDGSGIVFTRDTDGSIHFVNWDGSGMRKLTDGRAAQVWHEVSTGVDWVYYIAGPIVGENFAGSPLKRFRLDDPSVQETVWDKTQSCLDNIHLSDDGTQMVGLFPWPMVGVVDVADQSLRKVGEGCWTSISPDNRYLFWIFDGAHKNLLMRSLDGSIKHSIRINTSVGSRRAEVYHPRWSNHASFLTLTGPFLQMGEYNNITGGGIGIDAYVGKFNDDFTDVKEWYQLTDHPHADFFPDLWVQDQPNTKLKESEVATAGPALKKDTWPVHADDLVFVWDNSKSANGIDHPSKGYYRCAVIRKGKARFTRLNEMLPLKGYFIAENSSVLLKRDAAYTAMLNIRPSAKQVPAAGIILSSGNIALLQKEDQLFWLHGDNAYRISRVDPDNNYHISASYNPETGIEIYIQGERVETDQQNVSSLGVEWSDLTQLVFGGLPDGSFDWSGAIDGIAVYQRALSAEEIAGEHVTYLNTRSPKRTEQPAQLIVDARLIEISPTPTPEGIAPYRSALVEYLYEIETVIEGETSDDLIIVQHWAILDAVSYPLNREVGQTYRLVLESVDDHPELEGERISSELIEPVDIYLDVETE